MIRINSSRYLQIPFLLSVVLLMQCQSDVSTRQQLIEAQVSDTAEVTSFDIERENNSPELANWASFEVGQDLICTPPNWKIQKQDSELVISPANSTDSIERITFVRYNKNSSSLDYNSFARKLAESAFDNFTVQKGDTLNQLIFQQDFAYERNVGLLAQNTAYKGWCMVYVNDNLVYKYRIILAESRLGKYEGDLFTDIIGNLRINNQYIMSNTNPLKQIIFINK